MKSGSSARSIKLSWINKIYAPIRVLHSLATPSWDRVAFKFSRVGGRTTVKQDQECSAADQRQVRQNPQRLRSGVHSRALAGGVQQNGFVYRGGLACRGQPEGGQDQFVDLAQDAFGGLVEGLAGGLVRQRLRNTGGFELMGKIGSGPAPWAETNG